jgi:hypothetical protein
MTKNELKSLKNEEVPSFVAPVITGCDESEETVKSVVLINLIIREKCKY